MRCLSCQKETNSTEAKIVLQVYLCSGCATMAEKAVKELELEMARALEVAKHTLAQHIMQGGLMRTKMPPEDVPLVAGFGNPELAAPIKK